MPTSGSSRRCTTGSRPTRRASTRRGSTTSRRTATAAERRLGQRQPVQHHQRHARRLHHRDEARTAARQARRRGHRRATKPASHGRRPRTSTRPRPRPRWPSRARSPRPPSRPRAPPTRCRRSSPRPSSPTPATSRPTPCSAAPPPVRRPTWTSSLTVPTATSVRSVPVKLLWDNRTVINNHLARARGGKVSFTHLIGYALVKALRATPGDERRLRHRRRQAQPGPAGAHQPRPGHRHAEARRHPPAAGALDQGRREDGLRGVLDGVRGHRAQGPRQQADRRGLPGHHDLADQPGRHRHQPLGPPPDEGAGRDHRRRRDGVPARVAGRLRGRDRPQRDQQGDDADVDLRPPGHPGRPVG